MPPSEPKAHTELMPPSLDPPRQQNWLHWLRDRIPWLERRNENQMAEFAALEVFRHRYRDPKFFVEGIKMLGFTSKEFKVETGGKHIKFHIVRELSPDQRKYVRKYVDNIYATNESSEWA